MSEISFTEAFAKYGATLPNPQWAFSAIAQDGALVISCWQHKFTSPEKGVLRYSDCLSRWMRLNTPGKNLLMTHLAKAHNENLPVRLIIASTPDTAIVDAGEDASGLRKTFHVREDFIGQVVSFDGDAYVIDFKKAQSLSEITAR
jgi:hypothetical protein